MAEDKALAVVVKEVTGLVQQVQGMLVVTKEDYVCAVSLRNAIKAARKKWCDYWQEDIESADKTHKGLCAKRKEKTDILDQLLKAVDSKALPWKAKEDARIAAEQARINAEAQEKARREREAAIKAAEKLKTPELKEARLAEAEQIQPPEVTLESTTADVAGGGTRKIWRGEVVDMAALIAAAQPGTLAASFLMVNQVEVNKIAAGTKGRVPVAGVIFKEVVGFSGRA